MFEIFRGCGGPSQPQKKSKKKKRKLWFGLGGWCWISVSSGGGVSGWVGVFGGAQGERTGPVPVHPSRTRL